MGAACGIGSGVGSKLGEVGSYWQLLNSSSSSSLSVSLALKNWSSCVLSISVVYWSNTLLMFCASSSAVYLSKSFCLSVVEDLSCGFEFEVLNDCMSEFVCSCCGVG